MRVPLEATCLDWTQQRWRRTGSVDGVDLSVDGPLPCMEGFIRHRADQLQGSRVSRHVRLRTTVDHVATQRECVDNAQQGLTLFPRALLNVGGELRGERRDADGDIGNLLGIREKARCDAATFAQEGGFEKILGSSSVHMVPCIRGGEIMNLAMMPERCWVTTEETVRENLSFYVTSATTECTINHIGDKNMVCANATSLKCGFILSGFLQASRRTFLGSSLSESRELHSCLPMQPSRAEKLKPS